MGISSASPYNLSQDNDNLTEQLMAQSQNYKKLLKFVLTWTGKEPLLTQLLFRMMLDTEQPPIAGEEARWVDELVRSRLLKTWETDPQMKPLQMLRDRLTKNRDKRHSLKLLRCYRQIIDSDETFAENTPEQNELRLLGLLVQNRGRINVHNRIYEEIFNLDWVNKAIKKLEQSMGPDDEEFFRVFEQLERRLLASQSEIVAQIDDGRTDIDVNRSVHEVLRDVTTKVGQLVGADRTSVFLLNDEQTELWSLVAEDETGKLLDIRVRVGQGIAGLVAREKRVIHIPGNVYDDPRSKLVQESDRKYNYFTKNILAFPILNDNMDLVAVVQLLNKLAKPGEDEASFTHADLEQLAKCVLPIRKILETCQSTYEAIKRAQASAALVKATRSLDQVNLDTRMILTRVMDAAKELLNADRSTLWLYDDHHGDLWTDIPGKGEIRCPMGTGFAGQVAASGKLMIIPFDLYDDPNAENAKKIDAQTHYRTCSLLCMPVLSPDGDLLGVTQLVNKRKAEFPEAQYDPNTYPEVPPVFQASFDRNDRQSMQVFNERVGAILQFAKTHETLKASAPPPPPTATVVPTTTTAQPPPASAQPTMADFLALWNQTLNLEQDPALGTETFYGLLTGLAVSLCRQLQAQYSHFFFVDDQTHDLWTLVHDPRSQRVKEVRLPMNRGIAAKLLGDRGPKKSNKAAQIQDALVRLGLRRSQVEELRNVLFYPILDDRGNPMGILRLLNKQGTTAGADFSPEDIQQLRALNPNLASALGLFQQLHLNPPVRQAS
ncbi:MAG: GAF domain-containing protein [Spirulina sp. SIO3F2]|nr:GAF domain-containing protein [Spirulina sp. SIO3F2]